MQLQETTDGQHGMSVDWTTGWLAAPSLVNAALSWWIQILRLSKNLHPKSTGRRWTDEALIELVDRHCQGGVSTTFGSFLWAFLCGPLKVVPGRLQCKYEHSQFKDLTHLFHLKKLHATRSILLGPIKTHTCMSQGLSFERLGRLTSKLHENT